MLQDKPSKKSNNGVILNAYPDSLDCNLKGIIKLLRRPELQNAFSQLYLLPTIFNSDLDRGFSIVDYGLNRDLIHDEDLVELNKLNHNLKLDLVLNHLSINAPQFQDLIRSGSASNYNDFFIDWNKFWAGYGRIGPEGYIIPDEKYLEPLFMRKPGLPVLKVRFPDGNVRFFWNTFYQEVCFSKVSSAEIQNACNIPEQVATRLASTINSKSGACDTLPASLGILEPDQEAALYRILYSKFSYLGQLDLNARCEKVWSFYKQTLTQLQRYGATLVRLDAFAYLHKKPGLSNFFNRPGTWLYLSRLKEMAEEQGLAILPEIHAQYGSGLHEELADRGYTFYDFFFPGLVIDALERGNPENLLRWAEEIWQKGYTTINMLGCHDGIPLLDLKGGIDSAGLEQPGLLADGQIEELVNLITSRGGLVKDLYGPDGKKIAYYQINATFYSALGEDARKLLLARAIQLFMPGRPQVWYLDLFAGKNDYAAVEQSGSSGHKEINRTSLSGAEIEERLEEKIVLEQLKLIRLRNSWPAFSGSFTIHQREAPELMHISWQNEENWSAVLKADLKQHKFSVSYQAPGSAEKVLDYF